MLRNSRSTICKNWVQSKSASDAGGWGRGAECAVFAESGKSQVWKGRNVWKQPETAQAKKRREYSVKSEKRKSDKASQMRWRRSVAVLVFAREMCGVTSIGCITSYSYLHLFSIGSAVASPAIGRHGATEL